MGDRVLIDFAGALKETFREGDVTGRIGGDEFCVYMPGNVTELAVRERCETLRARVAAFAEQSAPYPTVTISIGALVLLGPSADFEQAYKRADAALYDVKQHGRDGYRIVSNG